MSEFWVSRKKWTCKYCDITINDDVPSRQQHENGLRHKGNVERHLRQAYKKSERDRKDERDAKREMEKIEKLAQQSYAKDVAGGEVQKPQVISPEPSGSTSTAPHKAAKVTKAWKPTNKLAAYGSALPLTTQEDEEKALQEWREIQEARSKVGEAGTWEVVESKPVASSSTLIKEEDREFAERDNRIRFEKEKQGRFGHDDDDEMSTAEIKVKKRIKIQNEAERLRQAEEDKRKELPIWKPMKFDSGPSAKRQEEQTVSGVSIETQRVKETEKEEEVKQEVVTQPSEPSEAIVNPTAIFKKRKAGAGAGAKKVRAVI